jgi:hypothetical protein
MAEWRKVLLNGDRRRNARGGGAGVEGGIILKMPMPAPEHVCASAVTESSGTRWAEQRRSDVAEVAWRNTAVF